MHNQNSSRRNFVKLAAFAGVATIGNPAAVYSETNNEVNGKVKLKKGSIILFQGDSITDAGRDYNNKQPNNTGGIGSGYAYLAAAQLLQDEEDNFFYDRLHTDDGNSIALKVRSIVGLSVLFNAAIIKNEQLQKLPDL